MSEVDRMRELTESVAERNRKIHGPEYRIAELERDLAQAEQRIEALSEKFRVLATASTYLTNAAAQALCEPRLFHENEGNRQWTLADARKHVLVALRTHEAGDSDA